ncbi:hypothetical protein P9E09_20045 [Bacillus mojavensis]|uniref:hypothetical protein n=1 Tax=Bacillus mojavensis subgroup TaxID=653388 RepID=UPI000D031EE7|nr:MULTISPECIES: hypothetical protein [Bacillus mojavensis subgroup]MEC1709849.1 hypothetical protein [Bacillus mojavensis]PRS04391.1 hypothetical protein C6W26_12315 [Bacillus halotolerans]QKS03948.1 hypothetical protein HT135_06465 [Bacillus halotolerans]
MKKFSKIVINKGNEVIGEGYYERYDDELIIEASDYNIERTFHTLLDQRVIISSIKFEDINGASGAFNGPYLIRRIRNNEITLQK